MVHLQRVLGNRQVALMFERGRAPTQARPFVQRGDPPKSVDPARQALIDFAQGFNHAFRSVLHAFVEVAPGGTPVTSTPGGRVGQASAAEVDPDRLAQLFTPTQRDKLTAFFETREIPERLFNGDDLGRATAQQRLLLAAQILATGTYRPGSFDQRVHAHFCWHWVQIVHHYAGATPATGGVASGVMGGFDPLGGAVLGSGSFQTLHMGGKVLAGDLPTTEVPAEAGEGDATEGGVGPIDAKTPQAGLEAMERAKREADPTVAPAVHRRVGLPIERFDDIRPGDWLWYYNANKSTGGSHSVIFSRWISGDETSPSGVRFREAICFSQPSKVSGGREHSVRVGDRFSGADNVFPITYVARIDSNAHPATTPDELLVLPTGKRATRIADANRRFLKRVARAAGRSAKGAPAPDIDLDLLRDWIREQNSAHLTSVTDRLTDGQTAMIEKANESDEIETLVRLNQRLRALATNARILTRNMEATFDASLNDRRALAEASIEELNQQVDDIDTELETVRTEREAEEQLEAQTDLKQEIQLLQRQINVLGAQIRRAPRGQARDALEEQRSGLRDDLATMQATQRDQRGELKEIRERIRALKSRTRSLGFQRQRKEKSVREAQGKLPYGLTHPGSRTGQDKGGMTGELKDLRPQPKWADLLVKTAPPTPGP